jgi:hypothetical protein
MDGMRATKKYKLREKFIEEVLYNCSTCFCKKNSHNKGRKCSALCMQHFLLMLMWDNVTNILSGYVVCITGHKSSSSIVLKQKQREFMDE